MDMSKSQRHTRSGADSRVSQANEAAIYPKLTGTHNSATVQFQVDAYIFRS